MSKVKKNSSAKKRFKFTGTGKVKRKRAYKRHILTKKTIKQKRRLGKEKIVFEGDMKNVKIMLNL